MVNGDRFFRLEIGQPTKTKSERAAWLFWFFHVLMKSLQCGNRE
jgi:hypothetical protein